LKIFIFGSVASGKTTYSRDLSKNTIYPVTRVIVLYIKKQKLVDIEEHLKNKYK